MITQKELRIGNWIKMTYGNHSFCTVQGIDTEFIYTDIVTFDYTEPDEFEPIELTEFWFLKLGFTSSEEKFDYFSRNKYRIFEKSNICFTIDQYGHLKCIIYKHIKYVHQLQNLYFALTGLELEKK